MSTLILDHIGIESDASALEAVKRSERGWHARLSAEEEKLKAATNLIIILQASK